MSSNGASGGYAARGVAVLDQAKPDWPQQLDLATFDMSRPGRSVLVQLFGSLDAGLKALGIPPDQAARFGFLDLDRAEVLSWLTLITARLVQGGPSGRPPLPPIE